MAEETQTEKQKPDRGKEKLSGAFLGAEAITFSGSEPLREVPPFETLPAKDRELYKITLNDSGNTERLVKRFGKNLSYVEITGWYGWDKKRWSLEEGFRHANLYAEKTAKAIRGEAIAAQASGNMEDETPALFKDRIKAFYRFAIGSGNYTRIKAMVKLAENHLWAKVEDFDRHKLLLNLQNGTLDLDAPESEKGNCGDQEKPRVVLKRHNRNDKITKIANIEYDPEATREVFEQFMRDIMPDDEVRLFLQRYFGYCLTGSTDEQSILMLWGPGSNGKSTLINIIHEILGDYGIVTPIEAFLHNEKGGSSSAASPELAQLPGTRFVSASEPDTGARFSDKTLKLMTGGEKMYVRALFKNPFRFKPQFKICISFNNKPTIRDQSDGVWRRILLVPFSQKFVDTVEAAQKEPGAKVKIKNLEEKLKNEMPGILNWLLDGYRMWCEKGLCVPARVEDATKQYRHESNPVLSFLIACTEKRSTARVNATRLYNAYKLWCNDNSINPISQTLFGRKMTDMDYKKDVYQVTYYLDIELTNEWENKVLEEELRTERRREE